MKLKRLILVLLVVLLFSGCSMDFLDPENLLRPPEPGGENIGLKEAIEQSAGTNIILKSPRSGKYRSAYILHDIDGDGRNEAIAFYKTQSDTVDLHFVYLKRIDDNWTVMSDFGGFGTDIYNIEFSDINIDNKHLEIVMSWDALGSSDKVLTVFEVNNNRVGLIFQSNFTAVKLLDVDGTGGEDILTLKLVEESEKRSSIAQVYSYKDNGMLSIGSAVLDGSVSSYAAINYDNRVIDDSTFIYIDSYVGQSEMITEVLYWNNGLVAPLNDITTGVCSIESRDTSIMTRDIDGDGRLEIPSSVPLYGNRETSLIEWSKLIDGNLGHVVYTYVNYSDQYMFIFPDEWLNKVVVKNKTDERLLSFYEWDGIADQPENLILEIYTSLSSNDMHDGFESVGKGGKYYYYYAKIYDESGSYDISINEIKQSFIKL